jgi:hypothetical protein
MPNAIINSHYSAFGCAGDAIPSVSDGATQSISVIETCEPVRVRNNDGDTIAVNYFDPYEEGTLVMISPSGDMPTEAIGSTSVPCSLMTLGGTKALIAKSVVEINDNFTQVSARVRAYPNAS